MPGAFAVGLLSKPNGSWPHGESLWLQSRILWGWNQIREDFTELKSVDFSKTCFFMYKPDLQTKRCGIKLQMFGLHKTCRSQFHFLFVSMDTVNTGIQSDGLCCLLFEKHPICLALFNTSCGILRFHFLWEGNLLCWAFTELHSKCHFCWQIAEIRRYDSISQPLTSCSSAEKRHVLTSVNTCIWSNNMLQ